MENGKWKMENGKWKMENGVWCMYFLNIAKTILATNDQEITKIYDENKN